MSSSRLTDGLFRPKQVSVNRLYLRSESLNGQGYIPRSINPLKPAANVVCKLLWPTLHFAKLGKGFFFCGLGPIVVSTKRTDRRTPFVAFVHKS